MRGIRISLSLTLAVGLLATSAVWVAAQDTEAEDGPWTAVGVTGTLITKNGVVVEEPSSEVVDGVMQIYGKVTENERIKVDDARLSGSLSRSLNSDAHRVSEKERVVVQSMTYRIDNEGGSWSGLGTALVHHGGKVRPRDVTDLDTVVLIGEGGYEGLSAYLLVDWTKQPIAIDGAIFSGTLPPTPVTE